MSHYSLDARLPQSMAEDVWLAPTAQVIGDDVVGREANIWFSAIVRGDNEPIMIGEVSYECLDVFLATVGIGTRSPDVHGGRDGVNWVHS
jgi:hypothetical protein